MIKGIQSNVFYMLLDSTIVVCYAESDSAAIMFVSSILSLLSHTVINTLEVT